MYLDYSSIFSCLVELLTKAIPIAIFFYLFDAVMTTFFSLAFPKRFKRGE